MSRNLHAEEGRFAGPCHGGNCIVPLRRGHSCKRSAGMATSNTEKRLIVDGSSGRNPLRVEDIPALTPQG